LGPAGSANSTSSIVVNFAPQEAGTILGEVVIAMAGLQEPYRATVAATVVQQTFQLVDSSNNNATVAQVCSCCLNTGDMSSHDAGQPFMP
jgi:hypothetical protein